MTDKPNSDERIVRHPNGHLMVERIPRSPLPTQEEIDSAFASISKAWPVLAQHASHMDGEFDNAVTRLRGIVRRLQRASSPFSGQRGSLK
jgi:hypothetical protein